MRYKSLNGVTADANGSQLNLDPGKVHALVGLQSISAGYGGGTVKLQVLLADGTTWFDVPSATRTANGFVAATNVVGQALRAVLTGSTTPSALSAWITVDDKETADVVTNS